MPSIVKDALDARDKAVESQESHPWRETHNARAWTCWLPQVAVGADSESPDALSTLLASERSDLA